MQYHISLEDIKKLIKFLEITQLNNGKQVFKTHIKKIKLTHYVTNETHTIGELYKSQDQVFKKFLLNLIDKELIINEELLYDLTDCFKFPVSLKSDKIKCDGLMRKIISNIDEQSSIYISYDDICCFDFTLQLLKLQNNQYQFEINDKKYHIDIETQCESAICVLILINRIE